MHICIIWILESSTSGGLGKDYQHRTCKQQSEVQALLEVSPSARWILPKKHRKRVTRSENQEGHQESKLSSTINPVLVVPNRNSRFSGTILAPSGSAVLAKGPLSRTSRPDR
ncbi:hypothetical protein RvY_12786 [Ramazzottius varieornatus]|uniref:Uncharacterized protein n=1 Tax=Ramazzottius varieornatus TaxID=947166 RepID=A0A1D1VKP9_RAMVA|nr:hypothetical protein RvY_12786 [Ramazzottius varieornatus]